MRKSISKLFLDADQAINSDVIMSVDWSRSHLISLSPVSFRKSANVSLILTSKLDFEKKRKHHFKVGKLWHLSSPSFNLFFQITENV